MHEGRETKYVLGAEVSFLMLAWLGYKNKLQKLMSAFDKTAKDAHVSLSNCVTSKFRVLREFRWVVGSCVPLDTVARFILRSDF